MKNLHLTKNQTSKMGIQPVMITDVALSEFGRAPTWPVFLGN